MAEAAHETRLARVLGVPLAEDAVRQWPQSGEAIRGRQRIAEVESHFVGLRLGVGRRHACGDTMVVEWSTDYGERHPEPRSARTYRIPLCCQDPFVPGVRVRDDVAVVEGARRVLALVRAREWLIRRAGRRGVRSTTLD
jgi:hypothetical protein